MSVYTESVRIIERLVYITFVYSLHHRSDNTNSGLCCFRVLAVEEIPGLRVRQGQDAQCGSQPAGDRGAGGSSQRLTPVPAL